MGIVKQLSRKLHLWLGLASGLIVCVVSLTGALLTFENELEYYVVSPKLWFVAPSSKTQLPIDALMDRATPVLLHLPNGHKASRVFLYNDPQRSVVVGFNYNDSTGQNQRGHVFLNPYSGQLLGVRVGNPHHPIWTTLTDLHINLLLGEVGSQLVNWGTLVFLVMVISGIVLWWPKNRAAANQRVWFRWKDTTRWKRKNYDLHNILGFYAGWVVLFMIITGAMWAFEWFNTGVYWLTSGGQTMQTSMEESMRPKESDTKASLYPINPVQYAVAYQAFQEKYPAICQSATEISVGYFNDEQERQMDVSASFDPKGLRGQQSIWAFFDKKTNRLTTDNFDDIHNFGDTLQQSTNELHYGTFFGRTSQIATFLACLIAASLPITGFYIWLGRRTKPKQPARKLGPRSTSVASRPV